MKIDKKIESYKQISNNKKLESLSISILQTINRIKNSKKEYEKYENMFEDNKYCLNLFFYELKKMLWIEFCCLIRDYSETTFHLFKNEKYKEIKEYIDNTNFLKEFISNEKSYASLSIELHNRNELYFNDTKLKDAHLWRENINEIFEIDKIDIDNIKIEFEEVINKFRKIEENVNDNIVFCNLENSDGFFIFLEELRKKIR